MAEVAQSVGVKFESWMQDWPLEVANPERLAEFIGCYEKEEDAKHRYLLAELIAYSLDDAFSSVRPPKEILDRAAPIMKAHSSILEYWACREAVECDEKFALPEWIRTL